MPVELQLWDWLNWLNWFKKKIHILFCNLNTICFCFNNDRWRFTLVPFFWYMVQKKKDSWYDIATKFLLHLSFQLWCICSTSKRLIAVFVLCASLISRHWTCREEFLTFFRADILGGSSCNKHLSDSERPEPSWGGAHRASQAGAAGAEPRGGCLVFLSCCHPVIGVRAHRTAVVTPSRRTGRASSGASIISPGFLV